MDCYETFHKAVISCIGRCDLPVLHRSGRISDSSFSASGFLGPNYEPYQARLDNHVPWCDRGTRKNLFLQVDLNGPLKTSGVATRGHKKHWQSWIKHYKVSYSIDNLKWKYVRVGGSTVM